MTALATALKSSMPSVPLIKTDDTHARKRKRSRTTSCGDAFAVGTPVFIRRTGELVDGMWRRHLEALSDLETTLTDDPHDQEWFCTICLENKGPKGMIHCDQGSACGHWAHLGCVGLSRGKSRQYYKAVQWNCGFCEAAKLGEIRGIVLGDGGFPALPHVRLSMPVNTVDPRTRKTTLSWRDRELNPTLYTRRSHTRQPCTPA
jgi:hypothetical protein